MNLSTRYGYADPPTSELLGDSSLGWTTLNGAVLAGATTWTVASSSAFPTSLEFDVIVGLRDVTTGLWSNAETRHVTVVSGTTWTVAGGSLAHASGESISLTVTALGLKHNPGALTDSGDMPYLNASGRMARLAAPANGVYNVTWSSGVPSWTSASSGISFADLASPPGGTPLGSTSPFATLNTSGEITSGTVTANGSLRVNDEHGDYFQMYQLVTDDGFSSFSFTFNNVVEWGPTFLDRSYTAAAAAWIISDENPGGVVTAFGGSGFVVAYNAQPGGPVVEFGADPGNGYFETVNNFPFTLGTNNGEEVWTFNTNGTMVAPGTVTATDFIPTTTRAAHLVYAGPSSGSAAVPTWRSLVAVDIPDLSGTYLTSVGDLSGTYSVKAGNTSLVTVGTITSGVWSGTAVAANKGGTGQTVYVVGDVLQASTTTALSTLAAVVTGNALISGGVGTVSAWGKVGLTTHVSGILPTANGGTGIAYFTAAGPTQARVFTFPDAAATIARTDAANTFTLASDTTTTISGGSITGSGTSPFLSINGTWNTSGSPSAMLVNVTNTASAATARFASFQVAGADKLYFRKDGSIVKGSGASLNIGGPSNGDIAVQYGGTYTVTNGGIDGANTTGVLDIGVTATVLKTSAYLGWASTTNIFSTPDLTISRAAAATAQFGLDINGAAPAQTITSCHGITGADRTGAPFHFIAGSGTGAGPVPYIDFSTPTLGTTGTTVQTQVVRVTINSSGLQATGYLSSDGSAGVTAGPFTTITGITVKNGLVTALTGA